MSDESTYTASFVGEDGTEVSTEQLEPIDGAPVKSLTRPGAADGEDITYELDPETADADPVVYRATGVAGHDYS